MAEPIRVAPPTDHEQHDLLRVAEAADRGGRLPTDLAACPTCVALHADLVALAAALPDAAVPSRPRDFQLTPADAARLRGWRRWWDAIGSSRDVLTRPLAIGLTTLGLAGLLVSAAPSVLPFGSAASAPAPAVRAPAAASAGAGTSGGYESLQGPAASGAASAAAGITNAAPAPSAAPAASPVYDAAAPGATAAPVDTSAGGQAAPTASSNRPAGEVAAPVASQGAGDELAKDAAPAGTTPSVTQLTIVSTILLMAGLALAGLRRLARRGPAAH